MSSNNSNWRDNVIRNPTKYDPLIVSGRVRNIRKFNGYTIEKAAELTGVSKSKLSKAENYKRYKQSFTVKFLHSYALAMCCTVDYLLGNENNPDGNIMNSAVALSLRTADKLLIKHSEKLALLVSAHAISESSVLPPYKRTHKDKVDLLNAVERFIEANREMFETMPESNQLQTKFNEVRERNKSIEALIKRQDFSSVVDKYPDEPIAEQFFLQLNDAIQEETTSDEYFKWFSKFKN